MASSPQTLLFQRAQPAAGTSVALNPQPFDNTSMVVIYNASAFVMLVSIGTAGGTISLGNSMPIPAGGAYSMPIGVRTQRPGPEFSGANSIIVDSIGGAGDARVNYFNQLVS